MLGPENVESYSNHFIHLSILTFMKQYISKTFEPTDFIVHTQIGDKERKTTLINFWVMRLKFTIKGTCAPCCALADCVSFLFLSNLVINYANCINHIDIDYGTIDVRKSQI